MKKRNLYLIFIIFFAINSCAWLDESQHQKIVGEYEIGWNDLESNRSISKPIKNCDGCYEVIVNSYVYAVGHNEKYIIAKQLNYPESETYYYIIDIEKNKKSSQNGIIGPLNGTEFEKTIKDLQIVNLKFDLNFDKEPRN
ncbi:hypothetical protein FLJC2902T_32340 [Flavobacterium limnosediminis JC2902]|uniref:Lipoprotein n=1 Tax=Flavobacterium limnosediminis JC2902 TaxID=1341181 RepID=V6SF79_9FLAO|nr:hypothetical protein [Flavobacterium limnosediminis]ESU23070.1 hypothetical protein FLJC2902T_32340 [Flavobacterium limnosediminis JC2902]